MTEEELSRYYWLKKEIKDLEERIGKLGFGINSITITDLPKGTSVPEALVEKIVQLRDEYIEKRISALEEYLKIENYIKTINEPDIRLIFRYRCLDLLSWDKVGAKMNNQDRTTVSKKFKDYINSHISHTSVR